MYVLAINTQSNNEISLTIRYLARKKLNNSFEVD